MAFSFFQRYKVAIFVLLGLSVVYFISRITNITSLPIFTDEALYIRWSQIAKDDASWRFISLVDGKQPMLIWLAMIILRFVEDPLLAGRLVSVVAGFFAMIGLFFLGREVFKNTTIGLLSGAFYVVYPFALVYDRMALYESLVSMFAVWGLYLTVLFVRYVRLDIALILGMNLGLAVLTKSNGFLAVYFLPVSLILFDWKNRKLKGLIRWAFFAGIAVVLVYAYYAILRLSPFYSVIEEKNALFVYPIREWIQHPFEFFFSNFAAQWDWLVTYMKHTMLLSIGLAFVVKKDFFREKIFLFLWFLFPFLVLALFGKTIYPRYILFMTLPLLPLIAYSVYQLSFLVKNRLIFYFLLFALFFVPIHTHLAIIFNFDRAEIPFSDVAQYKTDWPSGTGVKESIAFFQEQAKDKKIFVATEGTFGLLPYAYEIYLLDNPNIIVKGMWPIGDTPQEEVLAMSKKMPTFFAFYQDCDFCAGKGLAPETWKYPIAQQTKRFAHDAWFTVYKIE